MEIQMNPVLEAAVRDQAQRRGVPPETLVLKILEEALATREAFEPHDEWERKLFGAALPCDVSVPDAALSSDGLYD